MPREIPVHPHCKCAVAPVADEVPTGPAPEQKVPEGFEEPLPYKAPGETGKPQTYQHNGATVNYDGKDLSWTDYERLNLDSDYELALGEYVMGDYEEFNAWLRSPSEAVKMAEEWAENRGGDLVAAAANMEARFSDFAAQRDALDYLIDTYRLEEDAVLYRSCGRRTAEGLMKNQVYEAKNYQSTTLDLSKGEWFGSRSDDGYKNILVMNRTKGSKGFYVNNQESEVILPRGTRYKLLQVREVEATEYSARSGARKENYDKIRYLIVEAETP
jgi:hypothetical protein